MTNRQRRSMPLIRLALGLSLAAAVAERVSAGITITPLVLEGDLIRNVGAVTSINSIAVNDAGDWLVEVDTNGEAASDVVVLRNGAIAFRENEAISVPPGAAIAAFDSVALNAVGNIGWNLNLSGQPSTQDSGVYFNATLVLQEGSFSTSATFGPNTPYLGFFESRMDNANRIYVIASVDDPFIASSTDRAIVRLDYNPTSGTYVESVIAKESDAPPGATGAFSDFGTGPENSAINQNGEILYAAALDGPTATNGVLCINGSVIAAKGGPSPIPGRTYANIGTSTRLDLNDAGDVVFSVTLSGDPTTDVAIVRNSAIVAQEGMQPAALPGRLVTGFNSAPIRIDNAGRVVWYANLNGTSATNQAIFRDDEVVAQKGVTQVNGMTFTSLAGTTATGGISKGLAISPSGNHIIFRAVLNGTTVGAFLAEFEATPDPDLNGDGVIDAADLGILLGGWGTGVVDLNGDGTTDAADLAILLGAWSV